MNSPEIPDSQEAKAITSSPQGEEGFERAGRATPLQESSALRGRLPAEDLVSPFFARKAISPTATEHAPHSEHAPQSVSSIIRSRAHDTADVEDGASAIALVGTGVSDDAPQPDFEGALTNGSTTDTILTSKSPIAVHTNIQNNQDLIGDIDHNVSATAARSSSDIQAPQQRKSSIPSSSGESEHGSIPTITQTTSTSVPPAHAVSPTYVPSLLEDGVAASQPSSFNMTAPKPSVASLNYTQLYVILSLISRH